VKVRRHAGLLVVVLLASLVFGAGLASAAIILKRLISLAAYMIGAALVQKTWKAV